MQKKVIYEFKSVFRENMDVIGFKFGEGEKSVCIVGALRGNEIQQMYICSQIVKKLKELEADGKIKKNKSIMVIPSVNNYSMNIGKRFWQTDNTDINRMFPGYNLGETTQRVAAGLFDKISGYEYGIQFASFYIPGRFIPHVRMMDTGYEDTEDAINFGLPYVMVRSPKPYDTTTLNYNWQVWNCKAFSVFTQETEHIDEQSAQMAVHSVLMFLARQGIIKYHGHKGYTSTVISYESMVNIKSDQAGIFRRLADINEEVRKGDVIAEIIDPLDGEVKAKIKSTANGVVFFVHDKPLTYANTTLFKIIKTSDLK
ncbi:MAG: M14 family metallopeptidase [Firmicutes bacterium]|nr:M14 family metallopeptidase [Bacillota bacterium]